MAGWKSATVLVGLLWVAGCQTTPTFRPPCAFTWAAADGTSAMGCLANGIAYAISNERTNGPPPPSTLTWLAGPVHEPGAPGLVATITDAKRTQVGGPARADHELDFTSFSLPDGIEAAGQLAVRWIESPVDHPAAAAFTDIHLRPERLLITVVANQPIAEVVAALEQTVGAASLPAPGHEVPPVALPRMRIETTDNLSDRIELTVHEPNLLAPDWARRIAVSRVFAQAVGNRWTMAQVAWGEPFEVSFYSAPRGRGSRHWSLALGSPGRPELARWRDLLIEIERLRRWGFTEAELDLARNGPTEHVFQSGTLLLEEGSPDRCQSVQQRTALGFLPVACSDEDAAVEKMIAQVTVGDLNQLAHQFDLAHAALFIASSPHARRYGEAVTPDRLRTLVDDVQRAVIAPWGQLGPPAPPSALGTLVRRARTGEPLTLELGNGAVVRWHREPGRTLVLRASSPGGMHALPPTDRACAQAAMRGIISGGLGPYDAVEVHRRMAQRLVTLVPSIGLRHERMLGSAPREHVDDLFAWIYLAMTEMPAPPPGSPSDDALWDLMIQDPEPGLPPLGPAVSAEDLDAGTTLACTREHSRTGVRDRFRNAADFTFELWGDVDEAKLLASATRWLGAIPGDVLARERLAPLAIPSQATIQDEASDLGPGRCWIDATWLSPPSARPEHVQPTTAWLPDPMSNTPLPAWYGARRPVMAPGEIAFLELANASMDHWSLDHSHLSSLDGAGVRQFWRIADDCTSDIARTLAAARAKLDARARDPISDADVRAIADNYKLRLASGIGVNPEAASAAADAITVADIRHALTALSDATLTKVERTRRD